MKDRKFSALLVGLLLLPFSLSLTPIAEPPATPLQDPITTDHFQVQWGGTSLKFHSVEGLESHVEIIEYRDGISPDYTPRKIPGRIHNSNIILRRVYTKTDNEMWNWFSLVLNNRPEYRDLTISILDNQHQPVITFKISNAWPCAYRGPVLVGNERQLALEEIEIAHAGMKVEND